MDPVTLLIYVVILLIILSVAWYGMRALEFPAPVPVIVMLAIILVFLVYMLRGKIF